MSKIDSAIHEIHKLDNMSDDNRWVNRVHPLVKLLLTIGYIALTVSFGKYDILGLFGMAVYPIAMFILAEISVRETFGRLKVVLPLVCFIGLFNPFFDKTPVLFFGLTVRAGVVSMITLMLKGVFSVLASYFLVATTSIDKICYSLRLIHVPEILVTQIMLTYRYIVLLLKEVNRITDAYSLRAPGQKGIHFRVWGSLTGQLLLRSMDRATIVYESMLLRGYNGNFTYIGEEDKLTMTDVLYLILFGVLFVFLRLCPIVAVVGGAF